MQPVLMLRSGRSGWWDCRAPADPPALLSLGMPGSQGVSHTGAWTSASAGPFAMPAPQAPVASVAASAPASAPAPGPSGYFPGVGGGATLPPPTSYGLTPTPQPGVPPQASGWGGAQAGAEGWGGAGGGVGYPGLPPQTAYQGHPYPHPHPLPVSPPPSPEGVYQGMAAPAGHPATEVPPGHPGVPGYGTTAPAGAAAPGAVFTGVAVPRCVPVCVPMCEYLCMCVALLVCVCQCV